MPVAHSIWCIKNMFKLDECNLNLVHLVSNVSVFRSWVLYFFLYFCIVSSPSRVTVVSCSLSYDTYTCTSCLHTSSFPYTDLAWATIWHFDLGSSLWCKYEFFFIIIIKILLFIFCIVLMCNFCSIHINNMYVGRYILKKF